MDVFQEFIAPITNFMKPDQHTANKRAAHMRNDYVVKSRNPMHQSLCTAVHCGDTGVVKCRTSRCGVLRTDTAVECCNVNMIERKMTEQG